MASELSRVKRRVYPRGRRSRGGRTVSASPTLASLRFSGLTEGPTPSRSSLYRPRRGSSISRCDWVRSLCFCFFLSGAERRGFDPVSCAIFFREERSFAFLFFYFFFFFFQRKGERYGRKTGFPASGVARVKGMNEYLCISNRLTSPRR